MELPQYSEYGKILEMNPFAAWQAGQQMDLANTFQQQKLAQEQERAKAAQLANVFSEQVNPLKVEQQRQENLVRQYAQPAQKLAGEIAEETAPQQKQLALRNAILNLKQADITEMEHKARMMAYDPDPNVRAQGVELMQLTPQFIKLREEEAGKMAREKEQQRGATQRTGMTITAQKERAAATAAAKKSQAATLFDAVRTGKVSPDRALALYQQEEVLADTPEEKALFRDLSARMQTIINNREAARGQGKADIGALGMETRPAPQPYISPGTAAAPPQKHSLSDVQKMYPGVPPEKLRQAYKQKFGVDLQ